MADTSACWDWYFRTARKFFNFENKKEIKWGKVWEIPGMRQNSYFFSSATIAEI